MPLQKKLKQVSKIIFVRDFVRPKVYLDFLNDTKDMFEGDWLKWEPETLHREIERVLVIRPTEQVFEKIMALQTFMNTDLFWDEILVFENIVLAFGDRHVDFDLIQGCTPEELAYGVSVAQEIGKRRYGDFVRDIVMYIRACHQMAGVVVYHPALKFAQPEYSEPLSALVERVEKAIGNGFSPKDPIDLDDPFQVQLAKALDVSVYVDERLIKGMVDA